MTEGMRKGLEGAAQGALRVLEDLRLAAVDQDESAPGVAHVQRLIVLIEDENRRVAHTQRILATDDSRRGGASIV